MIARKADPMPARFVSTTLRTLSKNAVMIHLKQLKDIDPLTRIAEKQTEQEEYSPMNPPDAYDPPRVEAIPYEDLHSFLQHLMDDHKACIEELDAFEEILIQIQKEGIPRGINQPLSKFFRFLDEHVVAHHMKEEKILFPLLQDRLLAAGEHSQGPAPRTAVDMLEDDHIKIIQFAAVTFNFFGLAGRLPDPASRTIVLDAAIEQAKTMIEMLRLHIFREDNIVFPLAARHITGEELDEMTRDPRLSPGART